MTEETITEDDFRELMEQTPDDSSPSVNPYDEFVGRSGFSIVDESRLSTDAGMTAHRGVLVGDEYVDREQLITKTESELGFTIDEVRSVYTRLGGPVPASLRQLRDSIDARMLALSRSGANMTLLSQLLGVERRRIVAGIARAQGKE